MKVFITTYALTSGIQEVEADLVRADTVKFTAPGCYAQYAYKPNWHDTKLEAVARAEDMRVAKIASLRKSIAKLEKLTFSGQS